VEAQGIRQSDDTTHDHKLSGSFDGRKRAASES
jgi:hypothetical protein